MTLRWFDVHSPVSRYGVGKIEVSDDTITKTSPAYRWALSRHFETTRRVWERDGFELVERFECNCKGFNKPARKHPPIPNDSELYHRISP